jgi:hypothetical protein
LSAHGSSDGNIAVRTSANPNTATAKRECDHTNPLLLKLSWHAGKEKNCSKQNGVREVLTVNAARAARLLEGACRLRVYLVMPRTDCRIVTCLLSARDPATYLHKNNSMKLKFYGTRGSIPICDVVKIEVSAEEDAAFEVVDVDSLWRTKDRKQDIHWKG